MIQIYHGKTVNFSLTNPGKPTSTSSDYDGNHIPYYSQGLIGNFKNSTFTEYLIEVDRNSYITAEDEKLFSFGEIMQTIKKEIV